MSRNLFELLYPVHTVFLQFRKLHVTVVENRKLYVYSTLLAREPSYCQWLKCFELPKSESNPTRSTIREEEWGGERLI